MSICNLFRNILSSTESKSIAIAIMYTNYIHTTIISTYNITTIEYIIVEL